MSRDAMKAYGILVGARWFCGVTKKGAYQTAWTLAGAKLFQPCELAQAEELATALRERKPNVLSVRVVTVSFEK